MSNINNNNFHNLKLHIDTNEIWDFFLNQDNVNPYSLNSHENTKECLISLIDVSLYDCVFENEIMSVEDFFWNQSVAYPHILTNIGYCGYDNGLLTFERDKIMNKDFIQIYKDSEYAITDDKRLKLHRVTGITRQFDYPLTVEDDFIKLNGGFYQGFFKTQCDKYQVLPSTLEQGDVWAYEFVLKKEDFEKESNKTLNDKYPNNKGIFFFIGTRAENKWDYLYDKTIDSCFTLSYDDYIEDADISIDEYKISAFLDMKTEMPPEEKTDVIDNYVSNQFIDENGNKNIINECVKPHFDGCTIFGDDYLTLDSENDCEYDYIEDDIDISDFTYETDDGFIIGKNEEYLDTDNKFLMFDRTCNGLNVKTWKDGSTIRFIKEKNNFNENLFLLMDRTCHGYNVKTIDAYKKEYDESYDIYKDLYNNALAFRITDSGQIGYRYLVQSCDLNKKYEILEGYSKENIIKNDNWAVIHVKIIGNETTMKIKFYVNGMLVFVTKDLPKINLRKLNEVDEKQESVPYNISIGGGTQGLCETVLPNYMLNPYREYPLEENFAGSFIGKFKSFKMYNCDMEYIDIFNNAKNQSY